MQKKTYVFVICQKWFRIEESLVEMLLYFKYTVLYLKQWLVVSVTAYVAHILDVEMIQVETTCV